jgi:guanylate kinase
MKNNKGCLIVVSAPSGAGKTTLCKGLTEIVPGIRPSVSYTTRKPRTGELEGVHYHFVDETTFLAMKDKGLFVEWAEVHGNYYGTSGRQIAELTASGNDVVLDIDVQGAKQIRKRFSDSVLVFILPPSMDVLRERLVGRMSDPEDVVRKRLLKARDEIREYKNYDYVIINSTFGVALNELASIVIAQRARTDRLDQQSIDKNFSTSSGVSGPENDRDIQIKSQ